jgi:hypothetical protein
MKYYSPKERGILVKGFEILIIDKEMEQAG